MLDDENLSLFKPQTPRTQKRLLNRYHLFRWLSKHPKMQIGGGLGMAGFALSTLLSGAPTLAALFFFVSWVIWTFVIYYSPLWDKSRRVSVEVILVLGVVLVVFWWALLPSPPPTAKEIATEVRKEFYLPALPMPTPLPTPTSTPAPEERIFIDKPDDVLRRISECSRREQTQICTQPYIGKRVEISGRVHKIAELPLSQPPYKIPIMSISAKRKYPQKYIGAYCESFAESSKAAALLSDIGDAVTLQGRITKISGRRFWLEKCKFVK